MVQQLWEPWEIGPSPDFGIVKVASGSSGIMMDPHWRYGRTWERPCRNWSWMGGLQAHVKHLMFPRQNWIKFRDGLWTWLSSIFEKVGQELMKFSLFYSMLPSLLLQICKGGGNWVYIGIIYGDTEKCGRSSGNIFEPKFKQITKVFVLLMKVFKSNSL